MSVATKWKMTVVAVAAPVTLALAAVPAAAGEASAQETVVGAALVRPDYNGTEGWGRLWSGAHCADIPDIETAHSAVRFSITSDITLYAASDTDCSHPVATLTDENQLATGFSATRYSAT